MKSALLIIDVQHALCTGQWACFDIEAVVDRINVAAAKARAAGIPVLVIQHEDQGPLKYGSAGWQLYDRLTVRPTDIRVRKTASDSFHMTELQSLLQSQGVDKLIVCGVQSDFCVDSTTRRALSLGYPVVLVADGHSTMNNGVLTASQISAHHTETLSNLTSYGPKVTPTTAADLRVD